MDQKAPLPKVPEPRKFQIRIESALGGLSIYDNYASADQFKTALGLDPDIAAAANYNTGAAASSGWLTPMGASVGSNFDGASARARSAILWMVRNPKQMNQVYCYGAAGSVYYFDPQVVNFVETGTGPTDLNDGGTASANGMAYYDNYIYAARDTTIARFGPLDSIGTAAWTDDYWTTTLGKTAMTNSTYPLHPYSTSVKLPNHVMLRHSDGKLYIADVVGNQGVLHCISTTKTTAEGDTDNGSTFNAVDFPYGMWPTALASYGDQIAVGLFEGQALNSLSSNYVPPRARLALWSPSNPTTYDLLTNEEFPDPYIYAMLNSNGALYIFSGDTLAFNTSGIATGCRITRYLGGKTFEQVGFIDYALPPFPGGVEGHLNKIYFGSQISYPIYTGCVFAIGQKKSPISNAIFNVFNISNTTASTEQISGSDITYNTMVTSIASLQQKGAARVSMDVMWARGESGAGIGGDLADRRYGWNTMVPFTRHDTAIYKSNTFRIGEPFKITKIRVNLAGGIQASTNIEPVIYTDDETNTYTLNTINQGTDGTTTRSVVRRPTNATGQHNFYFHLKWRKANDGSGVLCSVAFPIVIDGEYVSDN